MKKEYKDIKEITTRTFYEEAETYVNALTDEATQNGSLSDPIRQRQATRLLNMHNLQ